MTFTIEISNMDKTESRYLAGIIAVSVTQYFRGSDEHVVLMYRDQSRDTHVENFDEFLIGEMTITNDDTGLAKSWIRGEDGKFVKPDITKISWPTYDAVVRKGHLSEMNRQAVRDGPKGVFMSTEQVEKELVDELHENGC